MTFPRGSPRHIRRDREKETGKKGGERERQSPGHTLEPGAAIDFTCFLSEIALFFSTPRAVYVCVCVCVRVFQATGERSIRYRDTLNRRALGGPLRVTTLSANPP